MNTTTTTTTTARTFDPRILKDVKDALQIFREETTSTSKGKAESFKRTTFASLRSDFSDARAVLEDRLDSLIKGYDASLNTGTISVQVAPGLSDSGFRFKSFDYIPAGLRKGKNKSAGAVLFIAAECLDDSHEVSRALLVGAMRHIGAAHGIKVVSNKDRYVNEDGHKILVALGSKPEIKPSKYADTKGKITRVYGYAPVVPASLVDSLDFPKSWKLHGTRPAQWTWGQFVQSFETFHAAPKKESTRITVECECTTGKDSEGNEIKVSHAVDKAGIFGGYFRSSCFHCGSAWRAEEDKHGKIQAVRVTVTEAQDALVAARQSNAA